MKKNEYFISGVFFGCIVVLFFIHFINSITVYPYDAGAYWNLGYEFGLNSFRFTNYSYGLRGYLLPFFHYILIKLADIGIGTERTNLWTFHSVGYTILFFSLFPRLMEKMWNIKINNRVRVLFVLVCLYFFKGLILYPLSDLPACFFFFLALYFLTFLLGEQNDSIKRECFYGGMVGVSLAAAYYIRPVYLIGIIGFIIIVAYFIVSRKKYVFLCSFLGMILVSYLQIRINQTHFDTNSPFIQTETAYEGKSLYLQQLNWGMMVQKYETNLDLQVYENPSMSFEDKIGKTLLDQNGMFTGYGEYLTFVVGHIVDVGCIYLKHLFNGLDITYNQTYIEDLNQNRFFIQFFNYTFLFLGIEGIGFAFKKQCWDIAKVGVVGCYFLPILLVIPTAVETRFFIGLHLLLYYFGCTQLFHLNRKELVGKKVVYYLLFLMVCFLLNSQTFHCFGIALW